MALPTGSGSEILKFSQHQGVTTTTVLLIPSPTANHIYTILSIIFTNQASTNNLISLRTFTNSALNAGDHWYLREQTLPGLGVFVWNDRFSFTGVLYLGASTQASGDMDIHTTYIDQDFS